MKIWKCAILFFAIGCLVTGGGIAAYQHFYIEAPEPDLNVYEYDLTCTETVVWHRYVLTFEAPSEGDLAIFCGDDLIEVYFGDSDTASATHHYAKGQNYISFTTTSMPTHVAFYPVKEEKASLL